MILQIPTRRQPQIPAPAQTEIGELREMFSEINERYLVDNPSSLYLRSKRIFDVAISLTIIVGVLSWLYPIVALLIKITSRGPVLFIQKRTGYLGKEFNCLKFRTMYLNDSADTVQATARDKRITPVGHFLRLCHIDELPQLINVIRGDMSVIGPRPHMLFHTQYYSERIPYYKLRHNAVPGLTGMAQIKGFIGEIENERELRKRIQWDIYYLKNRSIWLDVKIFFITFGQVIGKSLHIIKPEGDEE